MNNILFEFRHAFDLWLWHVIGIKHRDFDIYYGFYDYNPGDLFWYNLNEGWFDINP
jgi:hypothetical protein